MIVAKNNIIVKMDKYNPVEYSILNPISGSFDLMSESEYEEYQKAEKGDKIEKEFKDYLLERGYLYENTESQDAAVKKGFDEFNKEQNISQIQLLLIPTYSCNLACTYCFQHGIDGRPSLMSKEMVDSFFDYARSEFCDAPVKPFVTLFGGEPLMNSKAQREIIEYIITKCIEEDYEIAAVTNGYDFAEFVELLKKAKVKEIQFTLDGSKEMHDSRRNNLAKTGTFEKVVAGMEKAVKNGIPINLRSVVDKQNVDNLVEMADFLDKKGWLDLPPNLFKTQIGRNYELFECYEMPEHLFTQVEMWSHVAKLMKEFPVLEKFHKPDFMGIRYLMETGEMYIPSFDTCPAGKTEWVFDLYGDIYGCTASCGREDLKLGTYWPEIKKNDEVIQTWKDRNVTNIDKCKECKFDVICGGGCGVIAANKNNGEILSHDCRPIQGIYDVGMNFYAEKIKELENGNLEEEEIAQGCVICGSELIYAEIAQENRCDICGEVFLSNIKCLEGHYVCDSCHKGDLLDQIENLLVRSEETNPIRLAVKVFEMPTMKMNGPEYHSLVPGVLVTAYQNQQKTRDAEKIKESMERGQDIKGGSCGFHGNCGACVGVGIAESVLLGASPGAKEERGKANLATGTALIEISKLGGPLCCKRESITSIKSYMDLTGHYDTEDDFQYVCSQFKDNKSCIQLECPYFPSNQKKRMS